MKFSKDLWFLFLSSFLFAPCQGEVLIGIIQGAKEIVIKAKSQGEITETFLSEGAPITAGQVIAIIDDQQELIERNLASAEFKSAQKDYLDTKKLQQYVADEEILKKKDNFVRKKSNLKLKQYSLSNTRIVSPISGLLAQSYFEKGETVSMGDNVYKVVQMEELKIYVYVPASDLVRFSSKKSVQFKTKSLGDQTFQATVEFISPIIDSASGTVKIRLRLENPKDDHGNFVLKPGTLAMVDY